MLFWIGFKGGTSVEISVSNWRLIGRTNYQTELGLVLYDKEAQVEPTTYSATLNVSIQWTAGIALKSSRFCLKPEILEVL